MAEVSEAGTRSVLTILPRALIRPDTEHSGRTAWINMMLDAGPVLGERS